MSLPTFQTDLLELSLMQTRWAQQINPVLQAPANQSLLLKNISLVAGTNVINHLLGRKLQGWIIVRKRANAAVYDTQDSNQSPQLTLTLVSDNPVVVDLEVY